MLLAFLCGKAYDSGVAHGHSKGFQEGQISALHGQWAYAEQIIITTNSIKTNYVNVINGVPQAPVLNLTPVQNNLQLSIYKDYTAKGGTGTVLNIK